MSKKFLNIHVLYTFAGANPNRDDVGAPKTLVYGGKERSRMSAQAMTRAKRAGYESDPLGEQSFRSKMHSKNVIGQVRDALIEEGIDLTPAVQANITRIVIEKIEDLTGGNAVAKAKKASDAVLKAATKGEEAKAKESDDDGDDNGEAKDAVSIISSSEVVTLVKAVVKAITKGADTVEGDFVEQRTSSLSIAAYGRMFANRPKLQCEAAIQRGSAFTTHESYIEMDYFSVFDDLNTDDKGAAHLGMKQLTGGVYYWHASIDRDQLLGNLFEDFDLSDGRAQAFFSHLLNDLPQGMASTTATAHLVPFVLIVDADAPVSLQSAFEKAIVAANDGYLVPSVTALLDEHAKTVAFAPDLFGDAAIGGVSADLSSGDLPNLTLNGLLGNFATWVKAHG